MNIELLRTLANDGSLIFEIEVDLYMLIELDLEGLNEMAQEHFEQWNDDEGTQVCDLLADIEYTVISATPPQGYGGSGDITIKVTADVSHILEMFEE